MRSTYRLITPFITRDGSEIRELMQPSVHGNRNQSFAEATVLPGARNALHRHSLTAEIYHVASGAGSMTLGGEQFAVAAGDTICIAPGIIPADESMFHAPRWLRSVFGSGDDETE